MSRWKLVLAIYAAVFGILAGSFEATALIHAHEAQQRFLLTRSNAHLAAQVTVERDQALALEAVRQDLYRANQKADAIALERDAANQKVQDLQAQVDKLTSQLASANAGVGARSSFRVASSTSVGGNHFPFGWCTYYVASRRYVPWNGNAISWLWGARSFGFPTGSTPRVGAIMVSAESIWGHVAYVESVSSNGSFTVSEMNFIAWGMTDFRVVVPGMVPVLGFIY